MNAIIEAVKNMNFLIFGLIIFDAWTDILMLMNMKTKFPHMETPSERLKLKPMKIPEILLYRELAPEGGWKIYKNQLKQALDETFATLKFNFIQRLQDKHLRKERDILEFVYAFNEQVTDLFDLIDETVGPSKHITEHRKNWFDYEKLIPENLKSCDMKIIVNEFK